MAFLPISPGITALDVSAGGGYTTELLARAIGPTGVVYPASAGAQDGRFGASAVALYPAAA